MLRHARTPKYTCLTRRLLARSIEEAFFLLVGERRVTTRFYLFEYPVDFGLVATLAGILFIVLRALTPVKFKFRLATARAASKERRNPIYRLVNHSGDINPLVQQIRK